MRWLLWNVDWSLENNRIHCSSGASLQATGLAHEMHGRRQLPQSGLVHWIKTGCKPSTGARTGSTGTAVDGAFARLRSRSSVGLRQKAENRVKAARWLRRALLDLEDAHSYVAADNPAAWSNRSRRACYNSSAIRIWGEPAACPERGSW